MKKLLFCLIATLIIIMILIVKKGINMLEKPYELPGAKNESYLKGYKENIKSKNITEFSYECAQFRVSFKLQNNKTQITSTGGDYSARNGSAFSLNYIAKNNDIIKELQKIIEKYELYKNNGYVCKVNGLPAGLGDTINVIYDSGEKIYKHSNQTKVVNDKATTAIYDVFHKKAIQNGYDFTTEKSNVVVYDDATDEYLQGTWKGKHFGDEILVTIKEKNIKIYINNELTDDTEYIIINGNIRSNKLKKEVTNPKDENDYEEFNGISSIRKKNDIMLTAYFTKESYSTAELLIQR